MSELVTITNLAEVVQTDLAILYIDEEGNQDWIPKDQIKYKHTDKDGISIQIPEWLALKKSFNYT